jgi:hypothetical protein
MMNRELVRRRPGEKGCCACAMLALGSLATLLASGLWTLRFARRRAA